MARIQNNFAVMFHLRPFTKIAKMDPLRWIKWPPELKVEKKINIFPRPMAQFYRHSGSVERPLCDREVGLNIFYLYNFNIII